MSSVTVLVLLSLSVMLTVHPDTYHHNWLGAKKTNILSFLTLKRFGEGCTKLCLVPETDCWRVLLKNEISQSLLLLLLRFFSSYLFGWLSISLLCFRFAGCCGNHCVWLLCRIWRVLVAVSRLQPLIMVIRASCGRRRVFHCGRHVSVHWLFPVAHRQ